MKKRMIIGATAGALILALTTASVYASSSAAGSGYVDNNNDGICRRCGSDEQGACGGVGCQNGNRAMDGSGNQYGRQERTQCDHEQMNHGYCHRNQR